MKRERRTLYRSVSLSFEEDDHLDECVKASGKTRNRWLRDLIAAQKPQQPPKRLSEARKG